MGDYKVILDTYRNEILLRKSTVETMLMEWKGLGCNCTDRPGAPCCLLQTEYELLARYVDILDRELWHLEHKND